MKTIVFTLIFCIGFTACRSQRNIVSISDSKVKPKATENEKAKPTSTSQTNPFPSNQTNPLPSNQTNPSSSNQTNPTNKGEPTADSSGLLCSPMRNAKGNPVSCACPDGTKYDADLYACVLDNKGSRGTGNNDLCSDDLDEFGKPDSCACPNGMKYDPVIFACVMEQVPAVGNVTFYGDGNYSGKSVSLAAGSFTLAQLLAAGMANDAMSSLKVPKGWTVTVYTDDNFSGPNFIFTADTPFVPAAANDQMSSVKIQAP